MIPCASLDNGTILRVVPYFIPYQEDTEGENESGENEDYKEDPWHNTEGENESGEENEDYKEDPWHNTYESSDSSSPDSDSSLRIQQDSYIRPEYGESNAESAERQREINTRINARMHQRTRKRDQRQQRKQCVQELTLDDINPFGLYPNPVKTRIHYIQSCTRLIGPQAQSIAQRSKTR